MEKLQDCPTWAAIRASQPTPRPMLEEPHNIDANNNHMYDIHMIIYGFIDFTWDDAKAASNLEKHGVSFEEASTVFYDPYALVIPDDEHSYDEDRFVIVGISEIARVLTVCHCYRELNEQIRIISARKATKREEGTYWRRRNER